MNPESFDSSTKRSMLSVMLEHRRLIIALSVFGGLAGLTWQLLQPRHFTSYASFIGQSKRGASPLAGFAAQFGLAGIGSDGAQSPQFFDDLVTAPGVLRDVASSTYDFIDNGKRRSASLVDIYALDPSDKPQDLRLQHATQHLAKQISTSLSPKTGLISLEVRSPNPDLSVQIAKTIIEKVDAVNLRLRQTQAVADRQFAEMRVSELGSELHAAENRLSEFMATNKDFRSSARLELEQQRLSREVEMRQSVYGSMAASYEQDRIESVRDNPVITVVDFPIRPAKADSRGLAKGLVIGLFLGAMFATLGAYLKDMWVLRRREHQVALVSPEREVYGISAVQ
jgi:uncharacterized protein involved in exopolysaccharide biosynthesis